MPAAKVIQKYRGQRELPCNLSDAEIRERGDEIAGLVVTLTERETEEAARRKEVKDELEDTRKRVTKLGREISTRTTRREIECVTEWHLEDKMAVVIRVDTGEIIHREPLTPAQLQAELFEGEEPVPTEPRATTRRGKPLDG